MNATAVILNQSRRFPFQPELLEPTEHQILLGEIEGFATALNGCYDEMSPAAKAYALEMCHTLSKLRSKLTR